MVRCTNPSVRCKRLYIAVTDAHPACLFIKIYVNGL